MANAIKRKKYPINFILLLSFRVSVSISPTGCIYHSLYIIRTGNTTTFPHNVPLEARIWLSSALIVTITAYFHSMTDLMRCHPSFFLGIPQTSSIHVRDYTPVYDFRIKTWPF